MNDGRTIIDIVIALNRELRFNKAFNELLRPVDDKTAQRITQSYLEWINKMMECEQTLNEDDNEKTRS